MDRCHRLGQRKPTLSISVAQEVGEMGWRKIVVVVVSQVLITDSPLRSIDRPIKVTRLVIENSIESRILELQKKKENLAASALGDDDKAMGRLSPEDLAFLFSL